MELATLDGLEALEAIFPDISDGRISPDQGIIVEM